MERFESGADVATRAFGLAASAFVYPDEEFAQAVVSGRYEGAWNDVLGELGAGTAAFPASGASKEAFHALRVEYTNLFLNMPHPLISLYESVWTALVGEKVLVFANDTALAVKERYRAAGFEPDALTEPPDHLAYELGFLCELFARGRREDAAAFWRAHPSRWIEPFCAEVRVRDEGGFYAELCRIVPTALAQAVLR